MCGRFKAGFEFREIKLRWKLQNDLFEFHARYNIAPTQEHPVIVTHRGALEARPMRWGLIPYWTTTAATGSKMINLRAETTAEKPAFEDLLSSKRCLVPADGFYEWRKLGKERLPMLIQIKNRELFGFAGLWDVWRKPDGSVLESFTILTCPPNELMRGIHDRMPVIIQPKDEPRWLDPAAKFHYVAPLLAPYPSESMEAYPVSPRVNSVANDDKECAELDAGTLF
jgi:putative SOS response-associated peptidase YedK